MGLIIGLVDGWGWVGFGVDCLIDQLLDLWVGGVDCLTDWWVQGVWGGLLDQLGR